ncbi:MAG TPA: hypothetical protein VGF76_17365 [Polyangiaceae bacterium]
MIREYFGARQRGLVFAVLGFGLIALRCGAGTGSSDNGAAGAHASSAGAAASSAGAAASSAGAAASDAGSTGSDAGETNSAGGADDVGGSTAQAGSGAAGAQAGSGGGDLPPNAETLDYVSNEQTLPLMKSQFAVDLDGDGNADNAYGKLNGALEAQGVDLQGASDTESAAGRGLQLLALTVLNSNLVTSIGASSTLSRAVAQAAPDFGGTGSFRADGAAPSTSLLGAILNGQFRSVPIAQGSPPQRLLLRLEFGGPVDVPVEVYALSFQVAESGLSVGQLNGAIIASDMDMYVPPALAASLNQACTAQPDGTACKMNLSLFDANKDMTISADEVRTNALLKSVLAPDVKLLDTDGHYAPDAAATAKDSFSVGIGFSAVRAKIAM